MTESTRGITRRGFVGGAAAAAVGTALLSAAGLAGCAPQEKGDMASTGAEEVTGGELTPELNPQDESYTTFTTDYAPLFEPLTIG